MPWRTWRANGFEQRQIAVHRGALAYGYSFVTVLPGEDDDGLRAVMRGVLRQLPHAGGSPRQGQTLLADRIAAAVEARAAGRDRVV